MSIRLFDLTGRRALVTGSSRGLGFEIARGLGAAGAELVLNGRDKGRLGEAVERMIAEGLRATGCGFDVTKHEEVREEVGRIERDLGPVDILVSSAGIQRRAPLEEFAVDTWREVIDTDLTGVWIVAREVVKGMIERKRGKIVNICSLMSELGRPSIGAYAAAKGGVKMLTRAMAVEWAKHDIQVNGIGPGYFVTEMTRPLAEDPEFDAWLRARTPAGRWGEPKELVGTAVFLASAASDFVSGQVVYVDGGILAAL